MTPTDLLSRARLGDPVCHGGLTMFPLLLAEWPASPGYTVLDEALQSQRFGVSEISETGAVPTLKATNQGADPVFLLDGEELVGARQNRVLNLSLLVPPGVSIDIPVSCVESGRWAWRSRGFTSSRQAQFAKGRASKLRSVSGSLQARKQARSDQGEVWRTIADKAARMDASSPTEAMSAVYDRHAESLEATVTALRPVAEGQAGAVFFAGGRVIGLDLFDHPQTYAKLHGKLVRSYALDAMENEPAAAPPGPDAAAIFLAAMAHGNQSRFEVVGEGETVRLEGAGWVGAALEARGRCIHVAAFPAEKA